MAALSYDIQNNCMSAIAAALGDGAVLTIYAGTPAYGPSDPIPDDNTVLASFTLSTPSFNPPSGGNLDLYSDAPPIVATATASGDATWGRLAPATPSGDGPSQIDVIVGDANSSTPPDFLLSNTAITQGDVLTLGGGSLTMN